MMPLLIDIYIIYIIIYYIMIFLDQNIYLWFLKWFSILSWLKILSDEEDLVLGDRKMSSKSVPFKASIMIPGKLQHFTKTNFF